MDEKERRKALGLANGNPVVIADEGNQRAKFGTDAGSRLTDKREIAHFTHAIAEITRADYNELCYRYQGGKERHFILWDNRAFVVGDEAFNYLPTFDPQRGRLKYKKDYYGIMFLAGLLRMFGDNIPEAINALLAHPPADLPHRDILKRCVVGRWNFESNSVKYSTLVEYVNVFDEIAGGLFNATIAPDGKPYEGVDMSGRTLVFDLGGGTLDLAFADNGAINYDYTMESVRIGANAAINNFKRDFDATYPELVGNYEDGLPRYMIHELFLDDKHLLQMSAGETMDCSKLYAKSIAPVIRTARDNVRSFAGDLMGVRRVLLTGGVSGLMYQEIATKIFPKFLETGSLMVADQRRDLLKANARGGVKMIAGLQAEFIKRVKAMR